MICAKCNKKMKVKDCYNQNHHTYRVYKCPVCSKLMYTTESEGDKFDVLCKIKSRYDAKRGKV